MHAPRPLAVEIAAVLAVKTLLLALLWRVSFSEPAAPRMRLPTREVQRHLLPPSPPPETAHDQ
jgi:hypothetical protein